MGQIELPDEVEQAVTEFAQDTDWADGPADIIEEWVNMHVGNPRD
jgi:hypothetical protein